MVVLLFFLVLQWIWVLFGSLFDGSFGRPEVDSCRGGLILHSVCFSGLFCWFCLEKVGCKWSILQISVVALNCHIVILSILANPFWDDVDHPHEQDKLLTHWISCVIFSELCSLFHMLFYYVKAISISLFPLQKGKNKNTLKLSHGILIRRYPS